MRRKSADVCTIPQSAALTAPFTQGSLWPARFSCLPCVKGGAEAIAKAEGLSVYRRSSVIGYPPVCFAATLSLRLGHAAALTCHRHVIHYRGDTSLPDKGGLTSHAVHDDEGA